MFRNCSKILIMIQILEMKWSTDILGNFLAHILVALYTFNNLDLRNDRKFDCLVAQHEQHKGYESD